jgi:mRNA interferase MazF
MMRRGAGKPKRRTVAAITSQFEKDRLYEAKEGGLTADSAMLLDQIRSIDKRCLVKQLGAVKPQTIKQVSACPSN